MQESTTGSSLLSEGALPSWALFLVPVVVSALVIVCTSAAVLSTDPDPVDRNLAPSFDGQAHASIEEPRGAPAYQVADEESAATRAPSTRRAPGARRRGFSPVLAEGSEAASQVPPPDASGPAATEVVDDGDDEDFYDDAGESGERKPISPERRKQILEDMKSREDSIPFMRGFSRVVDRVRSRRAGDGAPAPSASGENSAGQNPPQEPPSQQGMAGSGNNR